MIWFIAYVAAMFFIALPAALFGKDRVAAAVFVVWAVGQIAYSLGAPEPQTQIALYLGAFALMWRDVAPRAHEVPLTTIGALAIFAPLALVCMLWGFGDVSDHEAWWAIYWLAVAQVALLVHPISWLRGIKGWLRTRSDNNRRLMMVAA